MKIEMTTPPGFYRHYLGGDYRVLFTGHDSTNGHEVNGERPMMVCYVSLTTAQVDFREENQFHELVYADDGRTYTGNPTERPINVVKRFELQRTEEALRKFPRLGGV